MVVAIASGAMVKAKATNTATMNLMVAKVESVLAVLVQLGEAPEDDKATNLDSFNLLVSLMVY